MVGGSCAGGSVGSGSRPDVSAFGFWATKTFLLVFVTNALADGIVPEQRTIAIEIVKTTDPPAPANPSPGEQGKGPRFEKRAGPS